MGFRQSRDYRERSRAPLTLCAARFCPLPLTPDS